MTPVTLTQVFGLQPSLAIGAATRTRIGQEMYITRNVSPLVGSWWAAGGQLVGSDFDDPSYNIVATRMQSGKSRM